MKPRIMYLENKSTGKAYIGRVTFSRTGKRIYYRGMAFQTCGGQGIYGNFYDTTYDYPERQEWWISGPKKNGQDSQYKVDLTIDDDVAEEYWRDIRGVIK